MNRPFSEDAAPSRHVRPGAQSPEHLRLLLENSQDVLVEVTPEGKILYVSPNVKRALGFEPREVIGSNVFDRVHPDDLSQAFAQLDLPLCWTTCRYQHKDGSWRWVETTGRDFKVEEGDVRSALIVRDITQHKQTETALYENQRAFSTLLGNLPGMAYRCRNDRDWTMDFVSNGCRALTGYKPEELVGNRLRSFGQLIEEPYRQPVWDEVQTALAAHLPFELQYVIRTAGGDSKWVWERGQGVFTPDGTLLSIEGFVMDITERKRAEQTLRESEEKFSKAFYASPDAMNISDLEHRRFIEVNDCCLKLFGYSRDEFLNRSSAELGLWESEQERQRIFEIFSAHGFVRNMEVAGRTRTGERLCCLLSAESIELNGRKCVVTTLHDVTRRRRAEEERTSLEAQLRQAQKMEAIGTLAGGIAHDFNNILAAIMAYTELARLETGLSQEVSGYLSQVGLACHRAKDLVRQILTFSRQQKQERAPIRLQPVIKEALKLMRSTLPSTVEIEAQIDPKSPPVLADPTQIHQVVVNLCTNAAHAMRANPGRLTLQCHECHVDTALAQTVPDLQPGRYVRFSVTDTGHGIDAETLKRIFEPFFTTKAPGEGTGLGLPVVHGIVREHEGAIAVQSQPGAGTTFDVYFPALEIESRERLTAQKQLPQGNGEQILFVDDEPAICTSMAMILDRLGYRVVTHTNPSDALVRFREKPEQFELVIADLTMPRMTGVELASQVLALRPGLPVMLTTGFSSTLTQEQIQALGIRSFLMKPFTLSALAEAIRAALDAQPPRSK